MSTPVLDPARESLIDRPTTAIRPPAAPSAQSRTEWSVARRTAFRFAFVYLVLYNLPFPFGTLPHTGAVKEWWDKPWHTIVPWFAAHVLRLATPITIFSNGSGDTTYDYVLTLVTVLAAALVTVIWSFVDRDRRAYLRLELALRVYLRYALAYALLSYGAFKVIKTQFPYPSLDRLIEPFGEFSPMGVVWSWMGVSYAYNIFAGLAEMSGGFLLFFRRTTMLGSLVAIAVMSNVVMINFAYDVPVKLYSTHLLLMGMYLLAPDMRRLVDACVLNRGMPPSQLGMLRPSSPRLRAGATALKALLVITGVVSPLWVSWTYSRASMVQSPLYGIWEVDFFARGQQAIPALVGDSVRWRRVVVSYPGAVTLHLLNDSTRGFRMVLDSLQGTLRLTSRKDSSQSLFRYARTGVFNDQLQLDGKLKDDSIHVHLHRVDESRFLLVNRGYHWINELPFNR